MKTYKTEVERLQRRRELQDLADDYYNGKDKTRSTSVWIAGIAFIGMIVLILIVVL